jgi:hypothetical protein
MIACCRTDAAGQFKRLFASQPEFRFNIPLGPAVPGTMYWRALTTTVNAAWYILRVVLAEGAQSRSVTLLFWWDTDLVKAIDQLAPERIESLICVLPSQDGSTLGRPTSIDIAEIWEVERSADHEDHLLLVDRNGDERMGMMAEICDRRMPRSRLLVRVGDPRGAGAQRQ